MKKEPFRDLSGAYTDEDNARFKPYRPIPWFWLIIAAGSLFWTFCAHAQQTLVYTGQPMSGTSQSGAIATGTVVLAAPLPPNGVSVVVPTSANFTGNLEINAGIPGLPDSTSTFSFTTVNGVITAWNIVVNGGAGNAFVTLSVTNLGDSYEVNIYSPDCQFGYPQMCSDTISSNTSPGTWSIPQAQVAPAMAAMNAQLATSQIDVRNLSKGYLDANAIINELNAAIMVCRHSPGAQCAKQ